MSGSSSANGSSPTISRAHHTAWPSPSGACWRVKLVWPGPRQLGHELVELGRLAALGQRALQLELAVEMVLDGALVAAGDEDEMLDAGGLGLVDHVLDHGAVDDRQHLLGHRLGGRQEPRAEPGYGENGLANALFSGWACLVSAVDWRKAGTLQAVNGAYAAAVIETPAGFGNCNTATLAPKRITR